MIVAGNSVDLLPYSGFWYKLAKADLFDLRIFDRFEPRGPQRRLMVHGRWASIPVIGSYPGAPLSEIRIVPGMVRQVLSELVERSYGHSPNWSRFGDKVMRLIDEIHTEHLWQCNLHLILGVRDLLGLRTPVAIGVRRQGTEASEIVGLMRRCDASAYLTDLSTGSFLGPDEDAGDPPDLDLAWSAHWPSTGDSILSILMEHEDPLATVLAERRQRHRASELVEPKAAS